MADWTDPKRPIYTDASLSPLGRLLDEIKMGTHPNKDDLDTVLGGGANKTLEFSAAVLVADQPAMDAMVTGCGPENFLARHFEEEFLSDVLQAKRWYAFEDAGTMSGLVEEWLYTYTAGDLTGETHKVYDSQGNLTSTETFDHTEEISGSTKWLRRIDTT